MSRKTLMGFFDRHYRPEQLVVAVVGDVSHSRVVRAFQKMARSEYPRRKSVVTAKLKSPPTAATPAFQAASRKWMKRSTEQVHLVWGVQAPHAFATDRYASFVLANYLGGGMSSRLFQEIREKNGLAYTVYSSFSPYVGTGLLTVYAATQPSKVKLCLELIDRECGRLAETKVARKVLERMKDNVKGTLLLALDSVESRMMTLGRSEAYFGRWIPMQETLKGIDAISPEQFQSLGRKLFLRVRPSVTLVGPAPSRHSLGRLQVELHR